MTASLFSAQWYRVARLRPRLRTQVQVQRQHWRDQRWYVLTDASSGKNFRINEAAYQFIGRCDGERSVHEVWNALLDAQPEAAPTQQDVLTLLGELGEQQLLQADRAADTPALLERRHATQRQRRRGWLNPFSFRLPLGDPSAWLARLDPLGAWLFRPLAFWLWLFGMVAAAVVAAGVWPALRNHAGQHLLSAGALGWLWLIYPAMKALHELGHALAVRRFGGEVHDVGLGLMLLVPAPYVDASAAAAFTRRWQRAAVGAAGVMVETSLAAVALCVWLATQPGAVHHAAFLVMFVGVASTLLFNANPLLRFDGYHVLCDGFELPNLATRSSAWWRATLAKHLLGSRADAPPHAANERGWLFAYAPLSYAYRIGLSLGLVLWLGGQWLPLGCIAALYCVVTVLLQPLVGWSRQALAGAQPGRDLARTKLRLGLAAAAGMLVLFVAPFPLTTVAPAVVWLPEQAQLRSEVDGFVAALPLADGAPVQVGDLLLRLDNPELLSAREQLASRLDGLRAEQFNLLLRDASAAQNLAIDIERTQAEWTRADLRVAQLEVRAATAGRLVLPRQADWLGAWVAHGHSIGQVLSADPLRLRAAVPEADAFLVRHRLQRAEVRLADEPDRSLAATVARDTPTVSRVLPSAALSTLGGGPYPADPAEKDGLHSLEPVFLVDLDVSDRTLQRAGGRAWVRFDHGSEPLAVQAYRHVAQLFLRFFSPAG